MPKAKAKVNTKIKVTLIKSGIGYAQTQRRTLKALGLTRLNKSIIVEDNLAMRGQILKVRHLVAVEETE